MSRSVDSSRRQSPLPGPVPARPGDASSDSIAPISNSTAAPAPSVSRPASVRWLASSTATIRNSPGTAERLSIRTTPAWPSDAADGTYGTVCASWAPQGRRPQYRRWHRPEHMPRRPFHSGTATPPALSPCQDHGRCLRFRGTRQDHACPTNNPLPVPQRRASNRAITNPPPPPSRRCPIENSPTKSAPAPSAS